METDCIFPDPYYPKFLRQQCALAACAQPWESQQKLEDEILGGRWMTGQLEVTFFDLWRGIICTGPL